MHEPIVPERVRNKPKKAKRKGNTGKQLGLTVFTLLALALIAYGAYYFFIPKEEAFHLDFYTYAEVGKTDFLETLGAKGTIVPKKTTAIEPKINGTIEEILVEEGQDVQAGEPLIKLYSEELMTEKNKAETELGEHLAKLAQLGIDHELELANEQTKITDAKEQLIEAEKNLELQKVLYGYGSIARVELEKAEQAIETAQRRLAQSERELELLQRKQAAEQAALEKNIAINEERLAKALEKIEELVIRAPFAGRILALKIPNNRVVTAHQELGELADLTEQRVEVQVAPGQTGRFDLGTAATIVLGHEEYAGEVSYIAPQAKQGTDGSTVLVRVDFLEEVSHIRPNSAVTANIHLRLHQDSLFLPRGAYLASGQQIFVYVIDGDTAKQRDVQFGLLQGNEVQIVAAGQGEVIISSYDAFHI